MKKALSIILTILYTCVISIVISRYYPMLFLFLFEIANNSMWLGFLTIIMVIVFAFILMPIGLLNPGRYFNEINGKIFGVIIGLIAGLPIIIKWIALYDQLTINNKKNFYVWLGLILLNGISLSVMAFILSSSDQKEKVK